MSSVDDRIVNMTFNNKQFTAGAAESQRALEGLDKTLANTGKGSTSGITALGKGVEATTNKFSAMKVAGVAAVATIASKATSAGLNLLKSFTLDPILDGFREYTTNLNSIQTVVANTGEKVSTVNAYMQKLNKYSDQTIYNFSEMARNIGTFTAAGVDLKTATASIQGIANIAALSGSNSQQASTAMYQLSQAIAANRVGLQDWNSVVNAGMGGKVFQTALANTAQAMGTLSANALASEGPMKRLTVNGESFRQSISAASGGESWLSGDVLTKTLSLLDGHLSVTSLALGKLTKKQAENRVEMEKAKLVAEGFTKAQAEAMIKTADDAFKAATVIKSFPQLMQVVRESIGSTFANAFQIILGDFNESKKLWGKAGAAVNGLIQNISINFLDMLKIWDKRGGRSKVIEGFSNAFKGLSRVMGVVKEAFREVFPESNVSVLFRMSKAFKSFTKSLIPSKDTLQSLKSIFGGVFAVLHIGAQIIKGISEGFRAFFGELFAGTTGARGGILSFLGSIGELLMGFDKWLTEGGKLSDFLENLGRTAGQAINGVLTSIGPVVSAVSNLVNGLNFKNVVDQFKSVDISFSGLRDLVVKGVSAIRGAFGNISGPIDSFAGTFGELKAKIEDFLSSGIDVGKIFSSIGEGAGQIGAKGLEIGTQVVAGLVSGLSQAGPAILGAIGKLASGIIEGFKSVLGIHSPAATMVPIGINIALGIGKGIGEGLKLIIQGLGKAGSFLKDAFSQLFGDMDAIDVASFFNAILSGGLIYTLNKTVDGIVTPFSAILKSGITDTFDRLGKTLKTFQNGIRAKALLDIALAVGVLTASIIALSFIKPEKIAISIGAIGSMMALLVGSLATLSKVAQGEVNIGLLAASMTLISVSMLNLAAAVAIFGNMDLVTLGKGFGSIAAGLAIMVGAMFAFSKIKGSIAGMAGSILVLSIAMNVMATAVLALGKMSLATLGKGLGAMAIGISLLVGAMRALDKMKESPEGLAASILVMAGAMVVLSIAVGTLGSMNIKTLGKGLGAVAIGMALMVGSLVALSKFAPGVTIAAGSMVVMAGAMVILATAVGIFGNMDMTTLGKGFLAIAVGLGLLLAAAALAQAVAPGLIVLGVTLNLIGQAMLYAGAGMLLFSAGLAALVALGAAGMIFMGAAIEAFLALLPTIAVQVAASFVTFIETIAKAAPRVRAAFSTIFENMIGVITDNIPVLANLFTTLLNTGIKVVEDAVPRMIKAAIHIIDSFLDSIAKEVPRIADIALTMIEDFLTVIDNHLDRIIKKGTKIIVTLLKGLGEAASEITDAAGQAILDILNAIDDAVVKYTPDIKQAGENIAIHLLDGFTGGMASHIANTMGGAFDIIQQQFNNLPFGRRGGKSPTVKNLIGAATTALDAAYGLVNGQINPDNDPAIAKAQKNARNKAGAELVAMTAARDAEKKARELEKIANKKDATKKQKKAAQDARKAANTAAAKAQRKSNKSDAADQALQDAIDYKNADDQGKADIKSQQAQDMAATASELLARANDEAARARGMSGKAAEKLMAKAKADAQRAKQLAEQAKQLQTEANQLYGNGIRDRADQIQADINGADAERAAQAQANADQKELDNAKTAEEKAKILNARAKADQDRADAARTNAQTLLDQARAIADTDAAGAAALLDQAEQAAAIAKEAADKAQQERQQAEQVLAQPGTVTTASGQIIAPSRTALEDAAKVADRYTESLAQASELAASGQQVVQYNQNIYSPTALSPTEVYRQSKTLLSASPINPTPGYVQQP